MEKGRGEKEEEEGNKAGELFSKVKLINHNNVHKYIIHLRREILINFFAFHLKKK